MKKASDPDQHTNCLVVSAMPCIWHAMGCCFVNALGMLDAKSVIMQNKEKHNAQCTMHNARMVGCGTGKPNGDGS